MGRTPGSVSKPAWSRDVWIRCCVLRAPSCPDLTASGSGDLNAGRLLMLEMAIERVHISGMRKRAEPTRFVLGSLAFALTHEQPMMDHDLLMSPIERGLFIRLPNLAAISIDDDVSVRLREIFQGATSRWTP